MRERKHVIFVFVYFQEKRFIFVFSFIYLLDFQALNNLSFNTNFTKNELLLENKLS